MITALAQHVPRKCLAHQPPTRLVPLDELKITRDMTRAKILLPHSTSASRAKQYRELAKTLLLWGRRWKAGSGLIPEICHQVLELVWNDCGRTDDAGFFSRSLLRAATHYGIFPGGSAKSLVECLRKHEKGGHFLGEQVRLDDLLQELVQLS